MIHAIKSKNPNSKAIAVTNMSEKTIHIGPIELKPGVLTPVSSLIMTRKTSYVDRLWRNGVIELGGNTEMNNAKETEEDSSAPENTDINETKLDEAVTIAPDNNSDVDANADVEIKPEAIADVDTDSDKEADAILEEEKKETPAIENSEVKTIAKPRSKKS